MLEICVTFRDVCLNVLQVRCYKLKLHCFSKLHVEVLSYMLLLQVILYYFKSDININYYLKCFTSKVTVQYLVSYKLHFVSCFSVACRSFKLNVYK